MRRHVLPVSAVFFLALLAYGNTLLNGFTWDDHIYIEKNPFVQDPGNLLTLLKPSYYLGQPLPVRAGARPFFLATLIVDHALWGLKPLGYHLTNLLLHAANAAWLYVLAWTLFGSLPLALGAAALFAVHPAGTEAVNAVSFRLDLLALFFLVPALLLYRKAAQGRRGLPPKPMAGSGALYWLGLLSKETAAVLPLLAALVEGGRPGRPRWATWGSAFAVYAAIFAAYGTFHEPRFSYPAIAQRPAVAAPGNPGAGGDSSAHDPSAPPWQRFYRSSKTRLLTMLGAFSDYVGWALWPARPAADRAPRLIHSWDHPKAWAGLLLLTAAAFWAVWGLRRHPSAFGAGWFVVCLLPAANVYPLFNPVAERYLYIPLAGFCLAAAAVLRSLADRLGPRSRAVYAGALAALLLPALGRTWTRNSHWRDDATLWASTPEGATVSPRVRYNRAVLFQQAGRLEEAIREYKLALKEHPGFVEARINLGGILEAQGRPLAARWHYERAVRDKPRTPIPYFVLGLLQERRGDGWAAVENYRRALKVDPAFTPARIRLRSLGARGSSEE